METEQEPRFSLQMLARGGDRKRFMVAWERYLTAKPTLPWTGSTYSGTRRKKKKKANAGTMWGGFLGSPTVSSHFPPMGQGNLGLTPQLEKRYRPPFSHQPGSSSLAQLQSTAAHFGNVIAQLSTKRLLTAQRSTAAHHKAMPPESPIAALGSFQAEA